MTRLECIEGSANKFWEATVKGKRLDVRWGRIGTGGQSKATLFDDAASAKTALARLIREKTKGGYRAVQAGALKTAKTVAEVADAKSFPVARNYLGTGKPFAALLARVAQLARAIPGPTTPIYLFEIGEDEVACTAAAPLTRIGGAAPGKPLPKKMAHVISIALDEVPELAARYRAAQADAAAISLFVPAGARGSEVEAGNVRLVSRAEVATSPGVGGKYRPLRLHRVLVPRAVFNSEALDESDGPLKGKEKALSQLYDTFFIHHGLLGNFNRLPDTTFTGPSDSFLLTISDAWVGGSDGRMVVLNKPGRDAVVLWHR